MSAIRIEEMIDEVQREIGFRQRAYPKWVATKKLRQEQGDRQIGIMQEVGRLLGFVKTVGLIERGDFDGTSTAPPVVHIRHGGKLYRYERKE